MADPAKSFERYADTNKGGAPRRTGKFDQSLNDREPFRQSIPTAEVDVDTSLAKIEDEVKNLSIKKSSKEDEYRPKSFTKAVSKQELKPLPKMEKGGIMPDPMDIDGDKGPIATPNATVSAMTTELDGMNKYLQGVRLPAAIASKQGAQLSYTL
jgi:hypothetical protein